MFRGAIILAAISAAGLATAANLLLKRAGYAGIAYYGPLFEEWMKTGSALILDVSIPGTHMLFGVLEAVGDCAWGGKKKFLAALCGVMAHTVFGLITYFLIGAGYPVYLAVFASIAAHVAWNTAILKLSGGD